MATHKDRRTRSARRAVSPPAQHDRRSPLPWQRPKSIEEDLEAPARVRRLMDSPSYRQADEDVAFLQQPETRGIRLQLDYWKAEDLLQAHGVEHTIVVFGSTRIPEPAEAHKRLEAARIALQALPDAPEQQRALRIAERVVEKSHYYDAAREFGRIVGRRDVDRMRTSLSS